MFCTRLIIGLLACVVSFQGFSRSSTPVSNPFELITRIRLPTIVGNWPCNGTHQTIREVWVCDGDIDCTNGYDEHIEACNKTECYRDEFDCGNGICIMGDWACDGDDDCLNGEDENNCTAVAETKDCLDFEAKCDDGYCIDSNWFCDGEFDCDDSSDETEKRCGENGTCPENTEYCVSAAQCLIPSCCSLGSDITNCSQQGGIEPNILECQQNEIKCTTNGRDPTCVVLHHQCDGSNDCDDGSDEGGNCSIPCEEPEDGSTVGGGCSHMCSKTPKGPLCSCESGYRLLENNKTCADINECDILNPCSQVCKNTEGSYKCDCMDGFFLHADGSRCEASGGKLLIQVGSHDVIREIHQYQRKLPNGSLVRDLGPKFHQEDLIKLEDSPNIIDVAYLHSTKTMVWLEKSNVSYAIKAKLVHHFTAVFGMETVTRTVLSVSAENMKPQRISIDWIENNVFFTGQRYTNGSSGDACLTCSFVGLARLTEISDSGYFNEERIHYIAENLENLVDIVVVSQKGILFTGEYSKYGRLVAMTLDGSDSWTIHRGVSWPISLAYDYITNELYWAQMPPKYTEADGDIYSIKSIPASSGSAEPKVILTRASIFLKSPFSIGVFNSKLFWYDVERHEVLSVVVSNMDEVTSVDKFERKNETDFPQRPITVTHELSLPSFQDNPCRDHNFRCEYACVLTSTNIQNIESNTNLAAECLCPSNKFYDRSISSCRAHPSGPSLITYENGVVRIMYKHGIQRKIKTRENHSAYSLVYDQTRDRVYYSDAKSNIYFIGFPTRENVLVAKTKGPTRYLTIDPTTGNIYWITNDCTIKAWTPNEEIIRYLKPESARTIFKESGYCPSGLAYDYRRHKLYFIDAKQGPALYSVMSDGSGLTRIQSASSLSKLIHMTYDPYEDSVVYLERGVYGIVLIHSMRINKNEFYLHKPVSPDVTSIAISPTIIYSYDAITDKVWSQRKSKVGEKNGVTVNKESNTASDDADSNHGGGLVYVDPDLLASSSNLPKIPCLINGTSKTHCSEFCFSSVSKSGGPHCACSDGYNLAGDNTSCIKSSCAGDSFYCYQFNSSLATMRPSSDESFPVCIPRHSVCDRKVADCYDGSDESTAVCDCLEPDFKKCKLPDDPEDGNYQCVKNIYLCDGELDCLNHADEKNCTCDTDMNFLCPEEDDTLALCIPLDWVNDDESDCLGGGDESNFECLSGEIMCDNGVECVDEFYLCDGIPDCSDDSDEYNCTATSPIVPVPTTTSSTTTTTTTPATTTKAPCSIGQYTCGSSECIRMNWVCDGTKDCSDGSDEGGKCEEKCPSGSYKALHCTSQCHRTPQGPTCPCPKGYYFDHLNVKCVDIDECAKITDNDCDQICENTPGSFKCVCVKGYQLEHDHRCKALGHQPFFLTATDIDFRLFTARSPLHYERTRLKLGKNVTINPTVFAIRGVADFYWVDGKTLSLYLSNEWSGETTLLARPIPDITFMSWDWIAQNLVWVHGKTIEAVTSKGQYSVPLFTSENKINGMALFPPTGTLYYSSYDTNANGKLRMCSMSEKQCKVVATEDSDIFRTLTVEALTGDLYWVMHRANRIERFTHDKKRQIVYELPNSKAVIGLHVFEGYVSWVEMNAKSNEVDGDGIVNITPASEKAKRRSTVYSLHKKIGFTSIIRENLPVVRKLEIIQKWSQPPHEFNPCIESPCPFICSQWVSTSTSTCTCPTKKLHITSAFSVPENKDCENLCPSPVLSTNDVVMLIKSSENTTTEVLCPGHETIYTITCEENGTWTGLPYCPAGVNVVTPGSAMINTKSNPGSAVSQHSDQARNIAIALIVLVMVIVIVCILIYWRKKKGNKWFGSRGFSPQKLNSPRTSTSDAAGLYNPSYVVSYEPNNENVDVKSDAFSDTNGTTANTHEVPSTS